MFSIKRLTKKFGKQTLSEVKPAPLSKTVDHTLSLAGYTHTDSIVESSPLPTQHERPVHSTRQASPNFTSCFSSSESEDEEESSSGTSRTKGRPHSPRKKLKKSLTRELRIERVPSAEKRKYSQYKCSTGNSSSCSSSDDEIKEAFECPPSHPQPLLTVPVYHSEIWSALKEVKETETQTSFPWTSVPFVDSNRPLKVVPVGHRKPKFFAQMSTNYNERPFLDFNKMQHSKRLVMVRRPIVMRNSSKVHSIQRPPALQVSLDISKHSFQPVLTQT